MVIKQKDAVRVAPILETRIDVHIAIMDTQIYVQVAEDPWDDGRRPERLWQRLIPRPPGKSTADCVRAAVRALGAGLDGWADLPGTREGVLPLEW